MNHYRIPSLSVWMCLLLTSWSFFALERSTVAFSFVPVISQRRDTSSASSSSAAPPTPCFLPGRSKFGTQSLLVLPMARERSKWDDLVDDDDKDDIDVEVDTSLPPPPFDMRYEPQNLKRLSQQFLGIRSAGGKELCSDIYVREPKSEVFWYTGKVARISTVSVEQAITRTWPAIEAHAANLRPVDLFPSRGQLEIWSAPGDSELEVAYNRPTMALVKHVRPAKGSADPYLFKTIALNSVGFQGEVYQQGEDGFRTWRNDEGLPARPEINAGGETRPPTQEELLQVLQEQTGQVQGDEDGDDDVVDISEWTEEEVNVE